MNKLLSNSNLSLFIKRHSGKVIERQQLIVYLASLAFFVVGVLLHLISSIGKDSVLWQMSSIAFLAASLLPFFLWSVGRMKLTRAFTTSCYIIQVVQSMRIVGICLTMPEGGNYLIAQNSMVSMMVMCALSLSYMRVATMVVGVADFLTIAFSAVWTGSPLMWQFFSINTLFILFFPFLTDLMCRNVRHLQDENIAYHKNERQLQDILRLNGKEIKAYIEMCRTDNIKDADTDRLFSMLSESSQRNVINAVERKKAIDVSRNNNLKSIFPDFTPMELEVSRLVLRDMKLSQIIDITGKSESNISSVRSHIRKKIGLSPAEDLREALLQRVSTKS